MNTTNNKGVPIDPRHDFIAKLRQSSLWPRVKKYIEWQRVVRGVCTKGDIEPTVFNLGPISINLDLTTACNFRCDHCIDWGILNGKTKHIHQKLLNSLEHMIQLGLRSVILIGGGEPTLYPRFGDVVHFLKEREIHVAVVSNGSRNNVILDIASLFTNKDWVRISLDAGSNDTFQRMHKPVNKISLENICSWVPRIRKQNTKVAVGFSFIITWEGAQRGDNIHIIPNIHEIVSATRLAHKYEFSYISFKPFLMRFPSGGEVMDLQSMKNNVDAMARIREAINEAKRYETDSFKVVESINLDVLERDIWQDFTNQPKACHMQAFRQVLSPLGLFNCPAYRGVDNAKIAGPDAYSNAVRISATQVAVNSIIKNFNAKYECREITCLYNPINWWLEKMINNAESLQEMSDFPDKNDYFL